ncbi:MAG: hypothetical protein MUF40_00325 [Gemmatimonadaceae bacterium]|nr:hypothetical protein [Gemmatimonadaceae bacterium]
MRSAAHPERPRPLPAAGSSRLRTWLARSKQLFDALGEFALPGACVGCGCPLGREPGPACGLCWSRVEPLPAPCCDRCGHPRWEAEPSAPCAWCALLPPWVRAVRSATWIRHGSTASSLVHALKYQGWTGLAVPMGGRIAALRWPADVERERACLVPVPLTPWRRRERGHNQAEALAWALAPHWGVPVVAALRRVRGDTSQTRLTPGERMVNVTRAFTVDPAVERSLVGAHVVLIDDVVTTAATLLACAAALVDGGARIVSCATFGRAPAAGDRPHLGDRVPWASASASTGSAASAGRFSAPPRCAGTPASTSSASTT